MKGWNISKKKKSTSLYVSQNTLCQKRVIAVIIVLVATRSYRRWSPFKTIVMTIWKLRFSKNVPYTIHWSQYSCVWNSCKTNIKVLNTIKIREGLWDKVIWEKLDYLIVNTCSRRFVRKIQELLLYILQAAVNWDSATKMNEINYLFTSWWSTNLAERNICNKSWINVKYLVR